MKHFATVLIAGLTLAGCSASKPVPPGQPAGPDPVVQAAVNLGVGAASQLGCSFIPAADRASALSVLATIGKINAVDPTSALNQLAALASNPAASWIWNALHSVIDTLQGILASDWMAYARGALTAGVNGCTLGLGVTPS